MAKSLNSSFPAISPPQNKRYSVTIDGIKYDSSTNYWRIATPHGTFVFNFNSLPGITDSLRTVIKKAFKSLLLSNTAERMGRDFGRLRAIFRFINIEHPERQINELTSADIINYGAKLPKHQQYLLRHLKYILILWAKTCVGGMSQDLLHLLPTLETKNHEIGAAVRTMDAQKGPLTDIEYEALTSALRQSFTSGRMSLEDYTMMVLAVSLGCRPLQLALIKTKDLTVSSRSDGSKIYILQVTRLKQGKRPRKLFKMRELTPTVGILLEKQSEAVRKWAKEFGIKLEEAPLFPYVSRTKELQNNFPGLEWHHDSETAGAKISRILTSLQIWSERSGEKMNLFQTRIRRTLGTRAAAEGLDIETIADLMDHSWIDSSLVYIETRPVMIERIDKALAIKIAPLSQAFAGTLIVRPADNGKNTGGRILHIDTPSSLSALGGCEKFDFCGLAAPLSCYTCSYFNPWLDHIHEVVLDRLLEERELTLKDTDLRIASVNDRTILAVADVVQRCQSMWNQKDD